MFETIDDIVLASVTKTRWIGQDDFWRRYEANCKRANCLPLFGQCKAALIRLYQAGKIKKSGNEIRLA